MILLEYEAKELLKRHGLPVPSGEILRGPQTDISLDFPVVLKVQIPKGGRGKAGGIKLVHDKAGASSVAADLLQNEILGCKVSTLLAEEALQYDRELYLAVAVGRTNNSLSLLAHRQGGVDIEQAASEAGPVRTFPLGESVSPEIIQQLHAYYLGTEAEAGGTDGVGQGGVGADAATLQKLVEGLVETCVQEDALLVEINPLMVLKNGGLACADAKVELDDAAAFRHQEWNFETKVTSSQFVELDPDGMVASMANGAGLAMATVDAITAAGARAANFYDVGGGTNVEGMVKAFQKIAAMPQVSAIVVNIFGGITRCDEVAEAIVESKKICQDLPVLFIRLTGTNETEGRKLLEGAGIAMYPTLADCVREAVKVANR